MDEVERIRAAHMAARPKPQVNPAWANAEKDIETLLREIDRLRSEAQRSTPSKG